MTEIERLAKIMAKARGCFDADGAAAEVGFPCPFCHWGLDAGEESGCFEHVRAIIQAMREPSEGMRDAMLRATTDPFVERAWRRGIDHILSEAP